MIAWNQSTEKKKICVIWIKRLYIRKFENYKYCLENNVNLKNKLDVNGLKESDKEVIKKIITKSQQKRKSEKHNVLT